MNKTKKLFTTISLSILLLLYKTKVTLGYMPQDMYAPVRPTESPKILNIA